jgi:SAM-dependent MidA family methyltransferase
MTAREKEAFSALQWSPPTLGQRCELHEAVRDWLAGWLPAWFQGEMLTIDYGDFFPLIYHRRPQGTLRAYLMHHRLEGAEIYERLGRQDITADVNFTDYRSWLTASGLKELWHGTQGQFILQHLPTAKGQLLTPDGAGGAFKVFIHSRSVA